jgi:twitching motility protein PilJ
MTPNPMRTIDIPRSKPDISYPVAVPPTRTKFLQGFYDLPIGTKQLIGLCIAQLVSVVGLAGGGALLNQEQGRKQLESQAKSELAVVEINYNIKINQMGFGFRGQSDNIDIIAAAKTSRLGQPIPKALEAQVSKILKNEITARKIEYATLVGRDRKILVSANANRQGETFDPNGLVTKILSTPDAQIKTTEIVTWEELKKENPTLPKGFTNQDALIRYTFTPVKDPSTGEVIGALVSGDIVNNKLPIVESTLKAFGGGYTAVYFRGQSGEVVLASSLNAPKGKVISEELKRVNQPLADFSVLQDAIAAKGTPVTRRISQGGVNYTVATKAIANSQNVPVALLVQATPETELEALSANSLLLQLIVTAVVLTINISLAFILGNAIAKPIKKLQANAQRFSEGDRDVRTEVFAKDEVGQLTGVFNQMSDRLQEVIDRQEAEVERIGQARQEARQEADIATEEQRQQKELLQTSALELLMAVDPISRGDLTVRAQVTEDEIGTIADSYNATVRSLREIVSQVQTASQQVLSTTNNSEVSIQSLSTEALRQAAEITTALQKIAEMTDSIALVTSTVATAESSLQEANATVKEGEAAMDRTVQEFLAIRNTVSETAEKVEQLAESSLKISQVVNLIGSFAAQTNILALNASMEAARAGEEGRGFAVVADEVRSLARQSAKATSEIEKMVADIQAQAKELAASMQIGAKQVATGTQIVDTARQSLDKISIVSAQINSLVEAIAAATITQSQASQSVTKTMNNVAAIADNSSGEAIHVVDGFKQLLVLAQQLQSSVQRFKVS